MKKLLRSQLWLWIILGLIIGSCKEDATEPSGLISISEYAMRNNLNPTYTPSGLGLIINDAGSSRMPNANSTVRVAYTGKLTNNNIFSESEGLYLNLSSTNLIECWKEGIPAFGEGGSGVLLSPSNLAFGTAGGQGIPSGADVIFDVELTTVLFLIDEYLTANNITPSDTTASGTKILIETSGDGTFPSQTDVVQIKYTGYFTDGEVFDTSGDDFVSLNLGNVIKGWQEGIPLFDKGAKGKLFIPYESAYGVDGFSTIPARTDLIFDIELQDFN